MRLSARSAAGLCLPDFLGIGAQKAGTTWLHENLKLHPQVFMPAEAKEVHFFDKHFSDYGLEGYSRLFRAGKGKTRGEITPAYAILPPPRIKAVRLLMPDVKLILILRNPIERAWSHAVMELASNGRPWRDISVDEWMTHVRSSENTRRCNYESILSNWLEVFPSSQLFLAFFDDLVGRPEEFLGRVFGFLGLTGLPRPPVKQRAVFAGQRVLMPPNLREVLAKMYEGPIQRLGQRYGAPSQRWLAPYVSNSQ